MQKGHRLDFLIKISAIVDNSMTALINEVKERKMFKISLRIHPAAFPTAGWIINAPKKGKRVVVSVAEVHTN